MKLSTLCLIGIVVLFSSDAFFVQARAQERAPQAEAMVTNSANAEIELPSDLGRLLREYEKAWRLNDADALALPFFTEDGFVLQNGQPPVRGREAIRALAHMDLDKNKTETGKFTLTLRRPAGGKWLIRSDMENMNRPAQSHAATMTSATSAESRP